MCPYHARYAPTCEKSTLFTHFFLVTHVYTDIFEWPPGMRSTSANYLLLSYKCTSSCCYRILSVQVWFIHTSWYFYFTLQGQQSIVAICRVLLTSLWVYHVYGVEGLQQYRCKILKTNIITGIGKNICDI